uniref:Uncharacterized protein n=1 Tax=Timema tahoe TaxID=61484 RepID=A0A7R9NXZ9_9NEOP|nr:unnamed protein product [Timema tahoe]
MNGAWHHKSGSDTMRDTVQRQFKQSLTCLMKLKCSFGSLRSPTVSSRVHQGQSHQCLDYLTVRLNGLSRRSYAQPSDPNRCPLQGFKPVCDGSVCLAWEFCLMEGRNLLFRPDLSTRRNVSPGTEFIGFSSWDVVQLGWIYFHSPSGADNGAKDTFPFLIWGQPRRQYSSLNRRKPSRLSQWRPAVAKEQKPDAGPGDANSEYIKLKVVGNINSSLESQMAVYLIARDTIDYTYVADD